MAKTAHVDQFSARLRLSYDGAVARVAAALKAEGFGILTEIDVQATLKQKLGVPFRKYVILGACNPHLAYRTLQADLDVGLLLPCNVTVYEDGPESVVCIVDPTALLHVIENQALRPIAEEAAAKLRRVVGTLTA
jgi:uncharacterized protein (DUF302 family)